MPFQKITHRSRANCQIYVLRDAPSNGSDSDIVEFPNDNPDDESRPVEHRPAAISRLNRSRDLVGIGVVL